MPFTMFPIFVPLGTHHYWVDRDGMVWEVFAQHLYTWINFSDLWELVNLACATIGVGDCEANQSSCHEALWFMKVHLEVPLLMHYSVVSMGCLFSHLWRCIVSTWKRMWGSGVTGKWFMHWTTTPTCVMHTQTIVVWRLYIKYVNKNSFFCD